jgi:hypothetical protein
VNTTSSGNSQNSEGYVSPSRRYDLRPIAFVPAQKLTGDEWHHAGNAGGDLEDSRCLFLDTEMTHDLGQDLPTRACLHRLLHEVAQLVYEQATDPIKAVYLTGQGTRDAQEEPDFFPL